MIPLRLFTIYASAVGGRFRYRIAEWQLAGAMALSGFLLLQPEETFSLPPYGHMRDIALEGTWGMIFLLTGLARLVALAINGYWRSGTALARACLAMMCAFIFLCLCRL
jgi:hypothetical protein